MYYGTQASTDFYSILYIDFYSILYIHTALLMFVALCINTEPINPYAGQLRDGHLAMSVTISASEQR